MTYEKAITELLEKVKNGEENAMRQLIVFYTPMIEARVRECSTLLEDDDIRQLCAIGLFEAAQSFDQDKSDGKVTFGLYAKLCIRNRLISELRKHKPTVELSDKDITSDGVSVEEDFIRREDLSSRLDMARKKLTPFEDQVLRLYLGGNNYNDVAKMLGKSRKSVDNALSRIRAKFRNLL